jgi:hypothetical protein
MSGQTHVVASPPARTRSLERRSARYVPLRLSVQVSEQITSTSSQHPSSTSV